jgi:hypothetical protein
VREGYSVGRMFMGNLVASALRYLSWSVAGLLLSASLVAAQTRGPLPPSRIQYPFGFEFKTEPPRGTVTPGSACEVADQYVRLVAAKRPATDVPELFAEDGVFLYEGKLRRGRKEIHEFYDHADAAGGAIPISFTDHGAECFMEVAVLPYGSDTWQLGVSDHFTITPDRKIARLIIYSHVRGTGAPPQGRPTTAKTPMALGALDHLEIEQLVRRYARAIVNCTNSGYDYADLYAEDGWFAPSRDGTVGTKWQGRERLAEAAGGGKGGCRVGRREVTHVPANHVIESTADGAIGRVDLVAVGADGDPFKVERQGHYEDTYVKTPRGWRFQSRIHVLRPGQTVTPLTPPNR